MWQKHEPGNHRHIRTSKQVNYALRAGIEKEEFIKELLNGLTPPPAYFPLNVLMNIKGYTSIDEVMKRGLHAMLPEVFEAAANETNALILDTRDAEIFAKEFIPNSINIGLKGTFAPWVGTLIPDLKQEILLVTEPGTEEEVITRLARVGYDYTIGYLQGGFESWKNAGKETDSIPSVTVDELSNTPKQEELHILDVRKKK